MPLIILIYCYGRIVWVLTRRIDSKLSSSGSSNTFQLARTNTIKTLLTVALCFVICWSNVEIYTAIYYLSNDVESGSYWNNTYFNFTVFMVFLNCTINPFIYLIKYKEIQRFSGGFESLLFPKEISFRKVSKCVINSNLAINVCQMECYAHGIVTNTVTNIFQVSLGDLVGLENLEVWGYKSILILHVVHDVTS